MTGFGPWVEQDPPQWPITRNTDQTTAPPSLSPPSNVPVSFLKGLLGSITEYASKSNSPDMTVSKDMEEKLLLQLMENATSLQQYQACAEKLDEIQRHNEWKAEKTSSEPEYNPQLIEDYMKELERARSMSDLGAMQHLLRTTLSRDLGGMNLQSLYKRSWSGTKNLIEDYIATVLDTIEKFAESAVEFKLDTSEVQFYQQSLEDALKYFGRSALTLSGGAIIGMKHIGVVKALWEADILPEIISGASAGSIVAAVVGVSNDEEMHAVVDVFPTADLACFDPDGSGSLRWLYQRASQFHNSGSFFSMNNMERVLTPWLGEMTFREAYYKTKRILNICVSSSDSGEPRILNYVTAPDVLILSAVCASCSVPGVFPAAQIYEKDPITKSRRVWMKHANQLFVDGSLDHDIPTRKLSEMFNVNFFIVSQVNPHVRMFLDSEEEFSGRQSSTSWTSLLNIPALAGHAKHAVRKTVLHRAHQLRESALGGDYLRWASVLSQKYTGDINILPIIRPGELTHMLANPSVEFMLQAVTDGERAAWPKIYRVKNCVAIELALIRAINTLRTRINFGPEAREAREANRKAGKGRLFSIGGQRPGFLRRRSLSTEHYNNRASLQELIQQTSNPPTPGPTVNLRRNHSLGQLDRFSFSGFTVTSLTGSPGAILSSRNQTPLMTPVHLSSPSPPNTDNIDNPPATGYFDESLKMTTAGSIYGDGIPTP